MLPTRAPLIVPGQLYLNADLNEYLIVTKNERGQIQYAGHGFKGFSEDESFLDRFGPVDPADVEPTEIHALLEHCALGTRAAVGFIREK